MDFGDGENLPSMEDVIEHLQTLGAEQETGLTQSVQIALFNHHVSHARELVTERLFFNAFLAALVGVFITISVSLPVFLRIAFALFLLFLCFLGFLMVEALRAPWIKHMRSAERIAICEWGLTDYGWRFPKDLVKFLSEKLGPEQLASRKNFIQQNCEYLPSSIRIICKSNLQKIIGCSCENEELEDSNAMENDVTPISRGDILLKPRPSKLIAATRIFQIIYTVLILTLELLIYIFTWEVMIIDFAVPAYDANLILLIIGGFGFTLTACLLLILGDRLKKIERWDSIEHVILVMTCLKKRHMARQNNAAP